MCLALPNYIEILSKKNRENRTVKGMCHELKEVIRMREENGCLGVAHLESKEASRVESKEEQRVLDAALSKRIKAGHLCDPQKCFI